MASETITPQDLDLPTEIPLPKRRDWRIGMIAFGGIARGAHAPAYQSVGWPMVAAADPDAAAQGSARDEFGIERVYADWRELIADASVEIVDLLTHPNIREEVVLAAAEAGKHIITEKPLAGSLAEAVGTMPSLGPFPSIQR